MKRMLSLMVLLVGIGLFSIIAVKSGAGDTVAYVPEKGVQLTRSPVSDFIKYRYAALNLTFDIDASGVTIIYEVDGKKFIKKPVLDTFEPFVLESGWYYYIDRNTGHLFAMRDDEFLKKYDYSLNPKKY